MGTIEGDVEFADGTKGKGTYEIWGKCGSISNLRVNANDPNACNNVSEAAAQATKEVGKNFSLISDNLLKKFGIDAH